MRTVIPQKKKDLIQEYADMLGTNDDFYFINYRGLTVVQATALRKQIRAKNAQMKVLKNTYLNLIFQSLGIKVDADFFRGPTAIVMAKGETNELAKLLATALKDTPARIKGGLVGREIYNESKVVAYSKLPGRLELLQKLLGTLNAPVQNFLYALNGVPTKFIRTLQALSEHKEKQS